MLLLLNLKGIGENSAWLLVREFFGWRGIRSRHAGEPGRR
jgi:hypothetical protein